MRRKLSIVACPAYAPDDPTPRGERGCERCGHRVHDLTTMTAAQLQELLQGRQGRVCVYARVRRDGTPVLRRPRRAMVAALGLAAVAACTPHGPTELELPGSVCEDADGFEVSCESEIDRWLETLPDEPVAHEEPEPPPTKDEPKPPPTKDEPEEIDVSEIDYLGMIDVVDEYEG